MADINEFKVVIDGFSNVPSETMWDLGSDYLQIGTDGTSELEIVNGGRVLNSYSFIAVSSEAIGTVNVTGQGSSWTIGYDLHVGQGGTGELIISRGASVSNNIQTRVCCRLN